MARKWVIYISVIVMVVANAVLAAFVYVRERTLRGAVRAISATVSEQVSTVSESLATFEADLLALKEAQKNQPVAATPPPTIKSGLTSAAVSKPTSTATPSDTASQQPTVGAGLVNLNTATQTELMSLPGIGASYADRIIAARPFQSVDQLDTVKGIGEKTLAKLRPLVTVK